MHRKFRIAAGGIIIHDSKILLVRYSDSKGGSYLVPPGGGVELDESLEDCVARELKEETGLEIAVGKLIYVEDLLSTKYRMLKLWFSCQMTGGSLRGTDEAKIEGISEV